MTHVTPSGARTEAKVMEMEVHGMFHKKHAGGAFKVVTCHISYPCKTYSSAHTVTGKDDEANEDVATSIPDIFKISRQKITTFEQTDGLVRMAKKAEVWLRMKRNITDAHYNLRWKILKSPEHGGLSKRNRLIMLTSWSVHLPSLSCWT